MGFCLSFPVLTHGSWGTVRHLLAFAPTNPPTDEQAPGRLCSSENLTGSGSAFPSCDTVLSQGPCFFCKSLAGHSTQGSALSCLYGERPDSGSQQLCGSLVFVDQGPARELLGD